MSNSITHGAFASAALGGGAAAVAALAGCANISSGSERDAPAAETGNTRILADIIVERTGGGGRRMACRAGVTAQ